MSDENDTKLSVDVGTTKVRRLTDPEVLKHQQSFEKRYSNIIQKQILETSINMEALQRQMHTYLSFSKSPPKSFDSTASSSSHSAEDLDKAPEQEVGNNATEASETSQAEKEASVATDTTKSTSDSKETVKKSFEKAKTVDITEKSVQKKK